jgi:glutathione synthase/RimK-type ligase-like ATP-grasp enzyme
VPPAAPRPLVALATCAALPGGDEDAAALVASLAAHGVDARPAVWDDPGEDWDRYALVVVRSTWDYTDRRGEYLGWAASVPRLANAAATVGWNTDKHHLGDLAAAGLPVVPTAWVEPVGPGAAVPAPAMPPGEFVVKPAVGAGSLDAARYGPDDHRPARAHLERLVGAGRAAMVQPYLAGVDRAGEAGLVFLDGAFSHAITKGPMLSRPPSAGDALFEPEAITARPAGEGEVRLAERALAAAAVAAGAEEAFLYARVDLLPDADARSVVIEVELTEPSLYLSFGAGAADRFAGAIAARVHAAR